MRKDLRVLVIRRKHNNEVMPTRYGNWDEAQQAARFCNLTNTDVDIELYVAYDRNGWRVAHVEPK